MKTIWPRFLKPTSLFARGLLMILVPVVVMQIIVGALVYQRYFYQVTKQLNNQVISEINFATKHSKSNKELHNNLNALGIPISEEPALTKNQYSWFDISGRLIRGNFEEAFGEGVYINSRTFDGVQITLPEDFPARNFLINRDKLAPINPHQIMINTLVFSLLLVFLSTLLLRNQIRSLRKLSQAAKAFGRGESVKYYPSGSDEIRSAGRSFLAMRNRISRQREQRNLMLSGVSHDLRTPLTRMKLSVEMLDDEQSRVTLMDDIRSIEELADSFLSYASNDAPEAFEDVVLSDFLNKIVSGYSKATCQNISNTILRLKPVLFRRAIDNILSNATRFASQIEITMRQGKRTITIYVDDNGPGIAEPDREKALKAFTRLDPARNLDQHTHVGLGMTIAMDAMRQHGGSLTLEESPLGGLRVRIDVPTKIEDI